MEVSRHMKYTPYYTNRIKKQLKNLEKRGYDMDLFKEVVSTLLNGNILPEQYNDHPLKGNKQGYRDCHIKSDWLLIYKVDEKILTLLLVETGTHSDIFE